MSQRIRLLIVDDEALFATALAKRLELRGFDVEVANSGDAAIATAKAHPFDIAIVDLGMPGMSGEETLAVLKKEHPYLELIVLTGHGSIDSAVECTKAGSEYYLEKPCEMDKLLTVLEQAYQERKEHELRDVEEKMEELREIAISESPLGILRRLKKLDVGAGR